MAETGLSAKEIHSDTSTVKSEVAVGGGVAVSARKAPGLRWLIIGLIFLATLINYIDRLTVSVLAPVITEALKLSNLEYASLGTWFLLAYTISQGVSGRLYDRIGARRGFTISITVWSLAAMAHAFARGLGSLSVFRFLLGLGEAGNWPGAAKVIAEWFPIRERAFAMGIFNSGAAIGSIVAPPIIVWLQLSYGWQATFIITGSLGLFWLALWLFCYQSPDRHRWITDQERELIADRESEISGVGSEKKDAVLRSSPTISHTSIPLTHSSKWRDLLRYKQVWAIVLGRLLVDPVWWLFITWLPLFLHKAHGFDLKKIGMFAWVPFVAADAGSLMGGAMSGILIRRGWDVNRARKATIGFAALLMPAGILAVRASDPMIALALIGVTLFGFQFWINNVQTLPSDFFNDRMVASVAGLGGVGAGVGSMTFVLATGWIVDHYGYTPVFTVAGALAPVGTVLLFALAGEIRKLPSQISNSKTMIEEKCMKNYLDLSGKVGLVTGAGSGIGRATAIALAEAGAAVAINYHRNEAGAEDVKQKILAGGARAITIQADVRRSEDIRRMVEEAVAAFGPIDILVNNAGSLVERLRLLELTEDRWDEVIDLNLKSAFLCAQAVAASMIERKSGVIVNVTSIAGRNGGALGSIHYSTAKGGMITMTKGLAKELAPHGVRVNAVSPGVIDTPFHEQFSTPEALRNFVNIIPMGRLGSPEEIARVIVFLASEASSYLAGETVEVNGGMLME